MVSKIREMRNALNMTQDELAKKAGVSRPTIIGLESKKETVTTTATLAKIASALGCSVSSLFCE